MDRTSGTQSESEQKQNSFATKENIHGKTKHGDHTLVERNGKGRRKDQKKREIATNRVSS